MKKHILFIDALEKLTIKKDSTLFFAHTLKERGDEVFLLFEKDFYITNHEQSSLRVFPFRSELAEGSFSLKSLELESSLEIRPSNEFLLHMRLDPPFDTRYLRYLWMLKSLSKLTGISVLNRPEGILLYNEKLAALEKPASLKTYIGSAAEDFIKFVDRLRDEKIDSLVLKPLDLYQGIGVEKIGLKKENSELREHFLKRANEYSGALIAQPFDEKVLSGEIRSIFFKGHEIGSIVKIPPKDSFLANIAQGATYEKAELNQIQRENCLNLCEELSSHGADWLAFDILGNNISEANVTCPGLLVEVSEALEENLAQKILDLMI